MSFHARWFPFFSPLRLPALFLPELWPSVSLRALAQRQKNGRDPPREGEVRKEKKENFLSISRSVRFRDAAQVIVSHTLPLFLLPTDQPGWAASTSEVIRNCQMDRHEECQGGRYKVRTAPQPPKRGSHLPLPSIRAKEGKRIED